jgi:hypothetical protein
VKERPLKERGHKKLIDWNAKILLQKGLEFRAREFIFLWNCCHAGWHGQHLPTIRWSSLFAEFPKSLVSVVSFNAGNYIQICLTRCPFGVRCRSEVAWLLGSGVRISLETWTFVFYVCCVLCRLRRQRRPSVCVCVYVWCVCVCVCNCVWFRNLKSEVAQATFGRILHK